MYSVLEKILQMDEGKVIVRSHDLDRDAQKTYAKYLDVMTLSTGAIMGSGEVLSYLTTSTISDGSWRHYKMKRHRPAPRSVSPVCVTRVG